MKQTDKIIIFTTENRTWGGSELLWSATARTLSESCTVHVLVYADLNLPNWLIDFQNINLHRINVPRLGRFKKIINRFLPYKSRLKPKDKRTERIKSLSADLIVINQGLNFNGVKLMAYAKSHKINYVTISQAVNEAFWPNFKLRQEMQLGFCGSLRNYFVSEDNFEVTQSQLAVDLKNGEVVRNTFNVPYNINIDYPLHGVYQLACVGRFDFSSKGQDVLLRVLSQEKWKNRNLIVNFYGSGKDVENLKDLIVLYNIKNAVLHEYMETIEIWKHNHGLVLTSRYEGLPIALVEAMLCGRLAVVTNVSGNAELIIDNVTGFIAQSPRPEYIDEALERAWNMRQDWQQIGKTARDFTVTKVPEQPEVIFADKLMALIN